MTRLHQGTIENRSHPRAIDNRAQDFRVGGQVVAEQPPISRPPRDFVDDEDYERAPQPVMIRLKGEGRVVEASKARGLRFNSSADADRFEDRVRQLQLERNRDRRDLRNNGYGRTMTDGGSRPIPLLGERRVSSSASDSPRSSLSSQPRDNEGPPVEPPPSETVSET